MRWRVPVSPAMVSRSVSGDAEPPSEPTGDIVGSEGGSEQDAKEWLDSEAVKIGGIWAARYPTGKDW